MRRILVVDDDDALRELIGEMLAEQGYSVTEAADGATGVRLAKETLPDLILCDLVMQGLDGYGVLTALRQDPLTAIIPLIFVTGVDQPGAMRMGMEHGAADYITKPILTEELLRAVEARLGRQAEARQEARRRLDSLKADIARSLPHEFLTPLTAVMGLSSLLMDELTSFEPEGIREVAAGIFQGGQRLHQIISKFSLHAELVAAQHVGGRPPGPGVQNAAAFVAEVARAKAAQLGRQRDLEVDVAETAVVASKDHLTPLVEELVENSLIYSPVGTAVTVRFAPEAEGWCLLSVSDRGRGMTPEQVDGLGTYVPAKRHDQEPGMSLGLAIVRRLVQIHGGELVFETRLGVGTTTRVRLPTR